MRTLGRHEVDARRLSDWLVETVSQGLSPPAAAAAEAEAAADGARRSEVLHALPRSGEVDCSGAGGLTSSTGSRVAALSLGSMVASAAVRGVAVLPPAAAAPSCGMPAVLVPYAWADASAALGGELAAARAGAW